MKKRDSADASRAVAPAIAAKDAVVLDNSLLDGEQTLQAALKIIGERSK